MKQSEKAIITCAVTGAIHMPCISPYRPDRLVDEAREMLHTKGGESVDF